MLIKCGELEVIATGSVIAFRDSPMEMRFTIGGAECVFGISFREDMRNREQRVDFESIQSSRINIIITNALSAFGTGTSSPVELGEINGRKISLSFRVYCVSSSGEKLLHYTWFMAPESLPAAL